MGLKSNPNSTPIRSPTQKKKTTPYDFLRHCWVFDYNERTRLTTEIGQRSTTTMALRSAPPRAAKPKPKTPGLTSELFRNPKVPFALALIFADAILVVLIIAYVPCKFHFFLNKFVSVCCLGYVLKRRRFVYNVIVFGFQIRRLTGTLTCLRYVFIKKTKQKSLILWMK